MAESTIWWALAGIAVAIELATGTFYLLMIALGLTGGAIAGQMGASFNLQLVVASLLGAGSVAAWHLYRRGQPSSGPASTNRDINLDIGSTLQVGAWSVERTATVRYRGADWVAELAADAAPSPGQHRIVEVVGNRLIVSPVQAA